MNMIRCNKINMRQMIFSLAAAGMMLSFTEAAAAPVDAGAQLERDREAMERERIAEEIREEQRARDAKVEREKSENDGKAESVTFDLKKINIDESEILTREEIDALTAEYVGRTVSLKDLYDLVEKLNALYAEKGYLTCRAFLPPQRIRDGEVAIRLVEGKTGELSVKGNKHTNENYIKKSFDLAAGEIANTDKLTRELQHFNGSHDAQLRMVMRAGKEPGTTDYEILVYEPKRHQSVTLFADNNGYETSGRWREGIYYVNRSVSGHRDALRVNYQRSQGTDAWGLGYSMLLNHHGMRLDLDYSGNRTEITDGVMRPFGVRGSAYAYGMTLRVPFMVDASRRFETGLQYIRQHSKTELGTDSALRTRWVDDNTSRYIPYVSFTHYGDSSVFYHKHSLTRTHRKDITGSSRDTWNWQIGAFYQKKYKAGQIIQARFDGQLTNSSVLASADRLYIGGANSVRGYEESLLAGEDGFTASFEYQVPIVPAKNVRALAFLDYGRVYGSTVLPDADMLISAGLGITATIKDVSAGLTLGIPLKRGIAGEKVDRTRLHFTVSATF